MNPKLVVIDTQSVLDWLVFANPVCCGWAEVLDGIRWQWVATAPMRAEFDYIAAKGFGERWPARPEITAAAHAAWAHHARMLSLPPPPAASARLACSDPDDQMFIDLAVATGAHTLVSRDKALLRLARKALERHGVRICTPLTWKPGLEPAATEKGTAP